ncbi:MAG: type II toxin-antitoxin system VapC family toxin [Bacteroidota bacterium]|nr:type II toxin-antitoxin system VapC family toxin [Bacteroidota bacterium]
MRLFLDTNVLYDLFEKSRPFHVESRDLIGLGIQGRVELILTAVSITTVIYSLRKYGMPMKILVERLNVIVSHVEIPPTGAIEVIKGINSGWSDLEDAIQFYSAISAGRIDAIVSNDKDFKQQKLVPVLTPAQALKKVKE